MAQIDEMTLDELRRELRERRTYDNACPDCGSAKLVGRCIDRDDVFDLTVTHRSEVALECEECHAVWKGRARPERKLESWEIAKLVPRS